MKISEKRLEAKLVKEVKRLGGHALKFHSSAETGFPDRLIILKKGKTLWVELKSTGRKPTKLQNFRIKALKELGHTVEVVDSEETLTKVINLIKKKLDMKELAIDIETYCDLDLKDVGVYKYAEHPSFQILMLAYAFDNEPVQIVDLANGDDIPVLVVNAIISSNFIKTAFNANFERVCLSKHILTKGFLSPDKWVCSRVNAARVGLPMSLDAVGKALGTEQQKSGTGKDLIRYFSMPCKPTKTNEGRTRNLPEHAPEKWEEFKEYCKQDVETERDIRKHIGHVKFTDFDNHLFHIDQLINDYGIFTDEVLIKNAIRFDKEYRNELVKEAKELTGLDNPNSPAQLKKWLHEQTGVEAPSLAKDKVADLLKNSDLSEDVERLLNIRKRMSKTSVKKYAKMIDSRSDKDGRIRGLFQFYGANRTGRWAGRLVQMQNLPRNKTDDLEIARELVRYGNIKLFKFLFDNPADILSQLIRTAFIAPDSRKFVVSDFSAIEARVIAWLAGETWRIKVFNSHGKIYEASAAKMLNKPIDDITKDERSKGKIAELALGYQGGAGALLAMGAINMGLKEEELDGIVRAWRASNPKIVELWREVQVAAIKAIEGKGKQMVKGGLVTIHRDRNDMIITLPSGRQLFYCSVGIGVNQFGSKSITYYGMDQTSKKWSKLETYGGKLVENIVQAIARDCLGEALIKIRQKYPRTPIVGHIHDEVVLEAPAGIAEHRLNTVNEILGEPISWAKGLPLKGAGFVSKYYKKD